jgi:hypothetical protein
MLMRLIRRWVAWPDATGQLLGADAVSPWAGAQPRPGGLRGPDALEAGVRCMPEGCCAQPGGRPAGAAARHEMYWQQLEP